jgi:hypothetical protein
MAAHARLFTILAFLASSGAALANGASPIFGSEGIEPFQIVTDGTGVPVQEPAPDGAQLVLSR